MNNVVVKRWLSIVCILSMVFVLIACGGGSSEPAQPSGNGGPSGGGSASTEVQPDTAGAGTLGSNFDEVLARAKAEGKLVWYNSSPNEDTMNELIDDFNNRYGLDVKLEYVGLHPSEMSARILAEKNAGKVIADAAVGSEANVMPLVENKMVMDIDWQELFAGHVEGVEKYSEYVVDEFKSFALEWRHLVYGIGYNTNLVKPEEVPATWDELLEPKWSGQIAIDPKLTPFARFDASDGTEPIIEYAKKFLENKPVLINGSPAVAQKVVTGETKLGVLAINSMVEVALTGAPVDFSIPNPMLRAGVQNIFLVKDGPNPNVAALFGAYLATAGTELIADTGQTRARSDEVGPFGDYLRKNNLPNPPVSKNMADVDQERELRGLLSDLTK